MGVVALVLLTDANAGRVDRGGSRSKWKVGAEEGKGSSRRSWSRCSGDRAGARSCILNRMLGGVRGVKREVEGERIDAVVGAEARRRKGQPAARSSSATGVSSEGISLSTSKRAEPRT